MASMTMNLKLTDSLHTDFDPYNKLKHNLNLDTFYLLNFSCNFFFIICVIIKQMFLPNQSTGEVLAGGYICN